ncbi:uncharacterized protein LOC130457528 [Monodelphis domestica]|uniref:uncharacterized protein LOC130457528 n=1 Tax=Monodelphis domestica TaxID=13616 RepID=UPI0024E21A01|nr:uncharacterized protein LOC130457528 [Monodelphis domestica]
MGQRQSIPRDSPLGCILKNWKKLTLDSLRRKKLIYFCNVEWPHYTLDKQEVWPIHGTLNYNTICQLDLFCRREGKWTDIPYISAFTKLSRNPDLRKTCRMCLTVPLLTPSGESSQEDVLDDIAFMRIAPLAEVQPKPPSSSASTETTSTSGSSLLGSAVSSPHPLAPKPPPYSLDSEPGTTPIPQITPYRNILLYPPLPDIPISSIPHPSPLHTQCGLSYGNRACLLPEREVPSQNGTIPLHVPFSMTDLAYIKEKLDCYSENHTKFIEGFKSLTLQFDLSWADLNIIISNCFTPDEKKRIWNLAIGIGDEKAQSSIWVGIPGATAVPGQDPGWDYQNERHRRGRDHMIDCLFEAMQKGIRKQVNYYKLKEVTQRKEENPALFVSRFVKAVKKYTNAHPECDEGAIVLHLHSIGQSAPDIKPKLQKMDLGPQIPVNQLIDAAFKVVHNRDLVETEGQAYEKLLTAALTSLTHGQRLKGSCYACGWNGNWSQNCPSKEGLSLTTCLACWQRGHLKCQCPTRAEPQQTKKHLPTLKSPEYSEQTCPGASSLPFSVTMDEPRVSLKAEGKVDLR